MFVKVQRGIAGHGPSASIADIGDDTILGNVSGGAGAVDTLTPVEVRTMINVENNVNRKSNKRERYL